MFLAGGIIISYMHPGSLGVPVEEELAGTVAGEKVVWKSPPLPLSLLPP